MTGHVTHGDVMDVLPTLPDNHFHGMLTDPPYGLSFMGREWDSRVPGLEVWAETLRVLKPGAYALVFGGTRTWHRLAVALEDAGFELRDTLMYLYGSGFPKSHDVSKAIDKHKGMARKPGRTLVSSGERGTTPNAPANATCADCGKPKWGKDFCRCPRDGGPVAPEAERWSGYGTALKPAWEPVLLVRKPLAGTVAANALEHGCGGLNTDGTRVDSETVRINTWDDGAKPFGGGAGHAYTGREPAGRWPANVIHDGSPDVLQHFPHTASGAVAPGTMRGPRSDNSVAYADMAAGTELHGYGDEGSAARFFYTAKASKAEREAGLESNGERANRHPTVKPLALTEYLARLILPPGEARILVPFSGSGSEMVGALKAGWTEAVGEYVPIAEQRIAHWTRQPTMFVGRTG